MKLFLTIALVLPALLFFSACGKNMTPSSVCIGLDDSITFQLKYGESKQLCDNRSSCISFTKVVSDSRCPVDVVCIWQGTAIIELETCNSKGESLTLEIHKSIEYTIEGKQYNVELVALDPYPFISHPTEVKDYVATITIKRK